MFSFVHAGGPFVTVHCWLYVSRGIWTIHGPRFSGITGHTQALSVGLQNRVARLSAELQRFRCGSGPWMRYMERVRPKYNDRGGSE